MTICQSDRSFAINVIAASPAASLVIPSIASLLGIEPSETADRLLSSPSTLATAVPEPEARRLSCLLNLFGLTVRLDPVLSAAHGGRVDLSIQPVGDHDAHAEIPLLAGLLDRRPEDIAVGLKGPGGVVVSAVDARRVEAIRHHLRRRSTLRIVTSDPDRTSYLMFCTSQHSAGWKAARRLGLSPCRFIGAAAQGLNRATASHLERIGEPGDLIVNRDFLRADLFVDAQEELVGSELMDFLATRPVCHGKTGADGMLRIDADLNLASAWQFTRDYAAIGLLPVVRIRGIDR